MLGAEIGVGLLGERGQGLGGEGVVVVVAAALRTHVHLDRRRLGARAGTAACHEGGPIKYLDNRVRTVKDSLVGQQDVALQKLIKQ